MTDSSTSSAPLRGAIIGYGFISSLGHMPAYLQRATTRKDVSIVAIADICEGRRAVANDTLRGMRVYPSAEALIEAEGRNLDFVDICTPPYDHARITHLALDHGLHVLCEKPLATTVEEARSMLVHAEKAQRVLFPCHNYKHAPVVKAMRSVIESGEIGRVRSVTLNTFRNTHARGVKEWNEHWRRERKFSGGGIAMDHGSHTFYLAFELLGEYPTRVTASMQTLDGDRYDTEDNFSLVLKSPKGLVNAHLSWTAGVRKVLYTVQGERGAITVADDELEVARMQPASGADAAPGGVKWDIRKSSVSSKWMDASHVTWFNSLFDDFAAAVRRHEWVGREAREAYLCIEIITAAYRSSHAGSQEQALKGYG